MIAPSRVGEKLNPSAFELFRSARCSPKMLHEKDIIRFNSKTQKTKHCWLWISGTTNREGYGLFWVNGQNVLAHHVAYNIFEAYEVPKEYTLQHTCSINLCVNPEHLFLFGKKDKAEAKSFLQDIEDKRHINLVNYDGFLYFIESHQGPIKIGWARRPLAYLHTLQEEYPHQLTMLNSFRATKSIELEVNNFLSDYKIQTDWFQPGPVKDFLAMLNHCMTPTRI